MGFCAKDIQFSFHLLNQERRQMEVRRKEEENYPWAMTFIISLTHQCLLFRFNSKKYLLGLTPTLAQDSASARLKPDHLILPALPYHFAQGLFLWHLPALKMITPQSIVVSDLTVRKRLEGLIAGVEEIISVGYKWQLLKQHELVEEHLWKIYEEMLNKSIPKPLREEPHGLAFNDSAEKLNIIVPETGRSLIIIHQGQVVAVDPGENFLGTLKYYGIPHSSLTAILLTTSLSLNFFQLVLNLPQRLTIITSEHLYAQLRRQVRNYFFWDEGMLRQRIRGNILAEEDKTYRFGSLQLSFSEDKSREMLYIDILFGMKRLRIRPQRLLSYPQQLVQLKDLELLVVYDMIDPIKRQLESAPAVYRKKILFDRPTRKLNNKYFFTLTDPAHFLTVQAHPYAKKEHAPINLSFLFKEKDGNYRLGYLRLTHGQRFNSAERTFYLREGYVRDQNGKLLCAPATITGVKEVVGQGNALIMHQLERNVYFYNGAAKLHQPALMTTQDLLRKVKENSFVRTLSRRLSGQMKEDQGEQVEAGSEWDILNSLCTLKTFQSGSEAGKGGSLLLIVKGGIRWRSSELSAGKVMGICNLRRFYSAAYQDGDEMQAVKDTWAIEIPLKELHTNFFSKFPNRMYELFSKNTIFE